MIGFIVTSLQLKSIITAHTLNSLMTSACESLRRISHCCLLVSRILDLYSSQSYVTTTVSRPVCPGIKPPYDHICIIVRQLRVCWCGALSLTRGRICLLKLLLVPASAVILGSESRGTRDHIVLFQIRDSPNLEGQIPIFISPRKRVAQL
jgi:hypothetical protein